MRTAPWRRVGDLHFGPGVLPDVVGVQFIIHKCLQKEEGLCLVSEASMQVTVSGKRYLITSFPQENRFLKPCKSYQCKKPVAGPLRAFRIMTKKKPCVHRAY